MKIDDFAEHLMASIPSVDPRKREQAADAVTDGLGAFSEQDADRRRGRRSLTP